MINLDRLDHWWVPEMVLNVQSKFQFMKKINTQAFDTVLINNTDNKVDYYLTLCIETPKLFVINEKNGYKIHLS